MTTIKEHHLSAWNCLILASNNHVVRDPLKRKIDSPTLKYYFKRYLKVKTETLNTVSMPVKSLTRLKPKQAAQPTSLMLLSIGRAEERRTRTPFLHPASLASKGRHRDTYLIRCSCLHDISCIFVLFLISKKKKMYLEQRGLHIEG